MHRRLIIAVIAALAGLHPPLVAEDYRFPAGDPGVLDITQPPYNADKTGTIDCTAAVRQAIKDQLGSRGFIYFPNGTYTVSGPLWWKGAGWAANPEGWWARLIFRGQSRDGTIIRLKDNCPGFQDPANPQGLIITASENPFADGGNNQGFNNTIRNLTVHTGSGNPGAIGIDYVVSNQGAIKDVRIVSGDGAGVAGIAMERAYPGPGLLKNLLIEGFDYGIRWSITDYSMTLEHITLKNQRVAGIRNSAAQSHIRNLVSVNTVPALLSTSTWQGNVGGPMNLIIGGSFTGGAAGNAAIVSGGQLLLRDVAVSGYGTVADDQSSANRDIPMTGATTTVGEFISAAAQELFPSPDRTLRLPIEETPTYAPGDPSTWAKVTDYGAVDDGFSDSTDSTGAIQAALDSGKPVVWFPGKSARYRVTSTLNIPASVRYIASAHATILGRGALFADKNNLKPILRVAAAAAEPLILDHMETGGGDGAVGLDQASTRTVAWQHGVIGGGWGDGMTPNYINSVAGGKFFIEDNMGSRYRIRGAQQVWARQLNTEYGAAPMVDISGAGARLWVLGWKTEDSNEFSQPMLRVADQASVEAFGPFCYMLGYSETVPWITNDNGRLSISYRQAGQGARGTPIRETRGSETRQQTNVYGDIVLYTGYTDTALPVGWTGADIGSPGKTGASTYDPLTGRFTVSGGGSDIWGTSDRFRFVHQPLTGDGTVTAHVISQTNTHAWAKAGVMIRDGTAPTARYAMTVVTPTRGVAFQRRVASGGVSTHTAGSLAAAPRWLRVRRAGTMFTGRESADGASWTTIGSATIAMPASARAGLCVTAHDNAKLSTAVFELVTVTPSGGG